MATIVDPPGRTAGVGGGTFDRPVLRENLWQVTDGAPTAFVETVDGCFEVATAQALAFLRIRPHCTPHNDIAEIAVRSGAAVTEVAAMLAALDGIGLIADRTAPGPAPDNVAVLDRLERLIALWAGELARDFIGNALAEEALPRAVLVGWLLETYHYVRDFPEAIAVAAHAAPEGALKSLLARYAAEERGHERFVLAALGNLGLSPAEVTASRPLVATRLIGLLMRELFEAAPAAALLMAAMVEAQDVPEAEIQAFQAEVEARYALPLAALAPYFEHQAIDAQLGHQRLFADHRALIDTGDAAALDWMVDKLHDLKHAFDLQTIEIKRYYGGLGAYVPRQPMRLAAL
ncbi:iron-containing redox enzyme family protein [Sphingomonas hylomeconis]|uniref:Iron-containing redox enzyme family protein n=1 Tax=Sphingomonas hylomeconis TaxID=1395958 RepID=A0ABV7STV9_9SPHN|nr:iron-containing redox enzyme family protein [Sphingomonas hylomeconis]